MFFAPLLAAGLLAAASVQPTDDARIARADNSNRPVSTSLVPAAPSLIAAGGQAPDFTYRSIDWQSRSLHHLLKQGSVLLVFGAGDDALLSLESATESLLEHDIVPVAVVNASEGDAWRIVQRCRLTYSLIADPHDAIAGQFGALDASRRPAPAWFVIDPSGRVRAASPGMPVRPDWLALAGTALGESDVHTAGAR